MRTLCVVLSDNRNVIVDHCPEYIDVINCRACVPAIRLINPFAIIIATMPDEQTEHLPVFNKTLDQIIDELDAEYFVYNPVDELTVTVYREWR